MTPIPSYPVDALTILVATNGRASLRSTLMSIRQQALADGDEVLLVHDGPENLQTCTLWDESEFNGRILWIDEGPSGDWGHTPRNRALPLISAGYVLHIDDDDVFAPDAFTKVRRAIEKAPGSFFVFQMQYPDGRVLWQEHELVYGNVGTPMFVHPAAVQLGTWGAYYGGDFQFIRDTIAFNPDRPVEWIPEVLVHIRPETAATAGAG